MLARNSLLARLAASACFLVTRRRRYSHSITPRPGVSRQRAPERSISRPDSRDREDRAGFAAQSRVPAEIDHDEVAGRGRFADRMSQHVRRCACARTVHPGADAEPVSASLYRHHAQVAGGAFLWGASLNELIAISPPSDRPVHTDWITPATEPSGRTADWKKRRRAMRESLEIREVTESRGMGLPRR